MIIDIDPLALAYLLAREKAHNAPPGATGGKGGAPMALHRADMAWQAIGCRVLAVASEAPGGGMSSRLVTEATGSTMIEAQPHVTFATNAHLSVLPPSVRLKHGPLLVTIEQWSDGKIKARYPGAALFGEGDTDIEAMDDLAEEIANLAEDVKRFKARGTPVDGPLRLQWLALSSVVEADVT